MFLLTSPLSVHHHLQHVEKEISAKLTQYEQLEHSDIVSKKELISKIAGLCLITLVTIPVVTFLVFEITIPSLSLATTAVLIHLVCIKKFKHTCRELNQQQSFIQQAVEIQNIGNCWLAAIKKYQIEIKEHPHEILTNLIPLFEGTTISSKVERWLKHSYFRFPSQLQHDMKESLLAMRSVVHLNCALKALKDHKPDHFDAHLADAKSLLDFLNPDTHYYDELKECIAKAMHQKPLFFFPLIDCLSAISDEAIQIRRHGEVLKTKALERPVRIPRSFSLEQLTPYKQKILQSVCKISELPTSALVNFASIERQKLFKKFKEEGINVCERLDGTIRISIPELPIVTFCLQLYGSFNFTSWSYLEGCSIDLDKISIPKVIDLTSWTATGLPLIAVETFNCDPSAIHQSFFLDFFTTHPDLKELFRDYLDQLLTLQLRTGLLIQAKDLSILNDGTGLSINFRSDLTILADRLLAASLSYHFVPLEFLPQIKAKVRARFPDEAPTIQETLTNKILKAQEFSNRLKGFYARRFILTGKEPFKINNYTSLSEEDKIICRAIEKDANQLLQRNIEFNLSLDDVRHVYISHDFETCPEVKSLHLTKERLFAVITKLLNNDQICHVFSARSYPIRFYC